MSKTLDKDEEYFLELKDFWLSPNQNLTAERISARLAMIVLLENRTMTKDGCVYYFRLKNLGLNVYEIQPVISDNCVGTYLEK